MDTQNLIKSANQSCKFLFTESDFYFSLINNNYIRLTGDSMSSAVNRYKNDSRSVQVLHWFDDFWLFIEMTIFDNNKSISISVFQGKQNDNIKCQLFRAEWDDYSNPDESHAQPHWHITANQGIEATFKEFAEVADNDGGFMDVLKEEKAKIIDINRIHFAMNGNWQNDEIHVHPIDDETKVVNWLKGVLSHLMIELRYVSS